MLNPTLSRLVVTVDGLVVLGLLDVGAVLPSNVTRWVVVADSKVWREVRRKTLDAALAGAVLDCTANLLSARPDDLRNY